VALVSVIITAYNAEKYIYSSLESICNQYFFNDYDVFIADDGSVDNTPNVIEKFIEDNEFRKINFFRFNDNKKIPTRANFLIDQSDSKYLLIQDADDISLPHRMKRQTDYMVENNNLFCLGSQAYKINEHGDLFGKLSSVPLKNKDIIKSFSNYKNAIYNPTAIFKRDVFYEIGKYNTDSDSELIQDYDLWTRAIISGFELGNLDSFLVYYRVNPKGNTCMYKREMMLAHKKKWEKFICLKNRR